MQHLATRFRDVLFLRLPAGADILDGLQRFVADHAIDNAVILNGFGSVTHYHFHVVASGDLPPEEAYPKGEKALDIASMSGAILKGRVHAHITFTDDRSAMGGHVEPGCRVLTFAMITLGVLDGDADLSAWDTWQYGA